MTSSTLTFPLEKLLIPKRASFPYTENPKTLAWNHHLEKPQARDHLVAKICVDTFGSDRMILVAGEGGSQLVAIDLHDAVRAFELQCRYADVPSQHLQTPSRMSNSGVTREEIGGVILSAVKKDATIMLRYLAPFDQLDLSRNTRITTAAYMVSRVQFKFISVAVANRFMSTVESYCPWMQAARSLSPAKHSPKAFGSSRTDVQLPCDSPAATPTRPRIDVYRDPAPTADLLRSGQSTRDYWSAPRSPRMLAPETAPKDADGFRKPVRLHKDLLDEAITPLRYPAMLKPLNVPQSPRPLDVFKQPDHLHAMNEDTRMSQPSSATSLLHTKAALWGVPETRHELDLSEYSLSRRDASPTASQQPDLSLTLPELSLPPIREPQPVGNEEPAQPPQQRQEPVVIRVDQTCTRKDPPDDDLRAKIRSSSGLYALEVDDLEEAIAEIIREPGFIPFVQKLERTWRARLMVQGEKSVTGS